MQLINWPRISEGAWSPKRLFVLLVKTGARHCRSLGERPLWWNRHWFIGAEHWTVSVNSTLTTKFFSSLSWLWMQVYILVPCRNDKTAKRCLDPWHNKHNNFEMRHLQVNLQWSRVPQPAARMGGVSPVGKALPGRSWSAPSSFTEIPPSCSGGDPPGKVHSAEEKRATTRNKNKKTGPELRVAPPSALGGFYAARVRVESPRAPQRVCDTPMGRRVTAGGGTSAAAPPGERERETPAGTERGGQVVLRS